MRASKTVNISTSKPITQGTSATLHRSSTPPISKTIPIPQSNSLFDLENLEPQTMDTTTTSYDRTSSPESGEVTESDEEKKEVPTRLRTNSLHDESEVEEKTTPTKAILMTAFYIIGLISALPPAMNAAMTFTGDSTSALGGDEYFSDNFSKVKLIEFIFGVALCSTSSISINFPQFIQYSKTAGKTLWNTFCGPHRTKKNTRINVGIVLPLAALTSVSSGAIGYGSFEWIPHPMAQLIFSSTNATVGTLSTLVTRITGLRHTITHWLMQPSDEIDQIQNRLTRALRKATRDPGLRQILNERLQHILSTDDKAHTLLHYAVYKFLLDETVLKTLLQVDYKSKTVDEIVGTIVGLLSGYAGWQTFAIKFIDGIDYLGKWLSLGSFRNAHWLAQLIPSFLAGIPTGGLYLINSIECIPLFVDALYRDHPNLSRKKLLLWTIPILLSAGNMLTVAIGVTNKPNNIYGPVLPTANSEHWMGYLDLPLWCALGAISMNTKTCINKYRELNKENKNPFDLDKILFWLEYSRLKKDISNSKKKRVNCELRCTEIITAFNGALQKHGLFSTTPKSTVSIPQDDTYVLLEEEDLKEEKHSRTNGKTNGH